VGNNIIYSIISGPSQVHIGSEEEDSIIYAADETGGGGFDHDHIDPYDPYVFDPERSFGSISKLIIFILA